MASYIMLIQFTDQGARRIHDSPKRAAAAVALGKKMGVRVREIYWTLGVHDGAVLCDAPNDETMTAYALSIASLGNVKTQTLRSFRAKEFQGILNKMK